MNTCTISEVYKPRPIHFHEIRDTNEWKMKIYTITYGEKLLEWLVYEDGFAKAFAKLPHPAVNEHCPGIGFAIAHQGRRMHYLILCWWDNENELFTRMFTRGFSANDLWHEASHNVSFCVWDMQVLHFECNAFVETILQHGGVVDISTYLTRHYHGSV